LRDRRLDLPELPRPVGNRDARRGNGRGETFLEGRVRAESRVPGSSRNLKRETKAVRIDCPRLAEADTQLESLLYGRTERPLCRWDSGLSNGIMGCSTWLR